MSPIHEENKKRAETKKGERKRVYLHPYSQPHVKKYEYKVQMYRANIFKLVKKYFYAPRTH